MKIIFTLLIIVLFSLTVSANEDYNETGNFNGEFILGTGFFNQQLTSTDSSTRSLSNPRLMPLVADLDLDGTNEIIVLDGDTVRLFQTKSLTILDSFDLGTDVRTSNMLIFDIDGNDSGIPEIIVAQGASIQQLHILEWNGSVFSRQNQINLSDIFDSLSPDYIIKCGKVNNCLIASSGRIDSAGLGDMVVAGFNSTVIDITNELVLFSPVGDYCFPRIKIMQYKDYDNDLDDEYIFSFIDIITGSSDRLHVEYIRLFDNLTPVRDQGLGSFIDTTLAGLDTINPFSTNTARCITENADEYITSPLVFDIDSSPSNGLETVVGIMLETTEFGSDDEFKMVSFDRDLTFLDDYPEFFDSDGQLLSNVFVADAFDDTLKIDFCVLANDQVSEILTVICASESTGNIPETITYDIEDTSGLSFTNLTNEFGNFHPVAHSASHSGTTGESEIISSYGVLQLDFNSCDTFGDCDLIRIFENPQQPGAVVMADVEKVGRDDMLVLTDTNIFYIDDKFTNSPGEITEIFTNPCIDSTWMINTTVEIRVTVEDVDGDLVSANVIFYDGDTNEQESGFSANVSSGTTFTFPFIANKTIGTGVITTQGRDFQNPTVIDEEDITFSVALNGVEFGDCTTTIDVLTTTEIAAGVAVVTAANITATNLGNNSIKNALEDISSLTNLGGTVIWLILMLTIAIGVWFHDITETHPTAALGVIAISQGLMLILGTLLGILPIGIIITIVVISIVFLGVWLGRLITGVRNQV